MSIVFHPVHWSPETNPCVLERYPESLIARSDQLRSRHIEQPMERRPGNLGVLLDWIYWSCAGRRATEREVFVNASRAVLERDLQRVLTLPIHTCPRVVDMENERVTFALGRFMIEWALIRESGIILALTSLTHPEHGRLEESDRTWNETQPINSLEGVDLNVLTSRSRAFEEAAIREPWIAENYGRFLE